MVSFYHSKENHKNILNYSNRFVNSYNNSKNVIKKIILTILTATILGFLLFKFWLKPAFEKDRVGINEAYIISKDFVQENLKAPATSDFSSEYSYDEISEKEFEIKSEVDSENSFGVKLRSTWSVKIKYIGGDWADKNSWILEDIIKYFTQK